ncbi:hypothetical protein [Nonomuraea sp. NPDC048901]|uniref:hypothetical protein n=1 Tax=Nonomuraea sp. NPDC048901 TaxID=3155627 RepID=UPI00340D033E
MTLAKYELIDAKKAHHAIARMCAWLGVSRSGYYEWLGRPASATRQRRRLLTALVAEIFADSHDGQVLSVQRSGSARTLMPAGAKATIAPVNR